MGRVAGHVINNISVLIGQVDFRISLVSDINYC